MIYAAVLSPVVVLVRTLIQVARQIVRTVCELVSSTIPHATGSMSPAPRPQHSVRQATLVALWLLSVPMAGCTRDAARASAQRAAAGAQAQPRQQALDELAAWSHTMTPEFHHQLRAYTFRPNGTILAHGARQLTHFSPTGQRDSVATAGENEALTTAPTGSHFGRLRLDHDVVARFELAVVGGPALWAHDRRDHHYYQIAPDARVVVGLSADMAHPGKPGTTGTFVFYDRRGAETGRFSCANPGSSTFTPDGDALLVNCRGQGLHLLAADGKARVTLPGDFRDVAVATGGRLIVAVDVARPTTLHVVGVERAPRTLQLPAPIRAVALTRAGDLAVVAAGAGVYGVRPDAATLVWRLELEGADPLPTSVAVGDRGLVAVGALLEGVRAVAGHEGPHPAVLVVARDGKALRRVEFEVARLAMRVPAVALAADERRLVVADPGRFWVIDVARLAP